MKHDWFLYRDGEPDSFRFETEGHNGPECRRCGWTGCEHCENSYYDIDIYEEECPSSQLDIPFE